VKGLAARFLDEYERLLPRLRGNPHQFPCVRRNIHRAGFRRFPYGLIFRIHPDEGNPTPSAAVRQLS